MGPDFIPAFWLSIRIPDSTGGRDAFLFCYSSDGGRMLIADTSFAKDKNGQHKVMRPCS
jgi:hypothetical protein